MIAIMTETTLPSSHGAETPIEVMRKEMRNVANEERKYHREAALSSKRLALGEIRDKKCFWNSNDIAGKARELKKRALSMDEYLTLQTSLIQNETNIESFLRVDNVLVALTRDLSSKNSAIQLIAANCCCNIALADARACVSLARTAGPYLVAELDSPSSHLAEVCAWTIGNLAAGSKIAFEALYAQGCFKRLCSILNDGDTAIRSSIIYAVKRCLYAGFKVVIDSEITYLACILIRHNGCFNDTEILWLFALISSREVSATILCPVLPIIFNHIRDTVETSSIEQITAAIRLFGNIVCESSGAAANAILEISNEKLVMFFEKILRHSEFHVRKETLWLIGNLYCHAQPRTRQRARDFVITLPSLRRVTRSDSFE